MWCVCPCENSNNLNSGLVKNSQDTYPSFGVELRSNHHIDNYNQLRVELIIEIPSFSNGLRLIMIPFDNNHNIESLSKITHITLWHLTPHPVCSKNVKLITISQFQLSFIMNIRLRSGNKQNKPYCWRNGRFLWSIPMASIRPGWRQPMWRSIN